MPRANQPTSFRLPVNLPDDVHPAVKDALKITYNGVKDLNDAIRALNDKVGVNTASITNVTQNVAAAAVSPSPTPAPVFGFVNLQPDLTPGAYTLAQADLGGLILVQSGIAFALTLNSGLVTPFFTTVYNLGAGAITATPSLGNVNSVASVTLTTGQFGIFYFDGTDWWEVFNILPQTTTPVAGEFLTAYDAATGLFTQAVSGGSSGVQSATVNVTSAEIKNLVAVPITLVAAPGAGKYILPIALSFQLSFLATQYTDAGAASPYVGIQGGSQLSVSNAYLAIVAASDWVSIASDLANLTDPPNGVAKSAIENLPFILGNSGGNDFAAGDGTLNVVVYYLVVTLV